MSIAETSYRGQHPLGGSARVISRASSAIRHMLDQLQRNLIPSDPPSLPPDGAATTIDLDAVLAAARRQYKVIAGTSVAVALLAICYIIAATPLYTSTIDILIDSRQFGAVDVSRDQADLAFNPAVIESQVEVLKSEKIALSVIEKLNLASDPEFTEESFIGSLISMIVGWAQFAPDRAGDDVPGNPASIATTSTRILSKDDAGQAPRKDICSRPGVFIA